MDIDWVHPGDHCNLETSSHPWEARLLWKFDSKTEMCGFCNCVAACWEGFHRCTDALENQIWTWRMFFGDGKWVLMTCLYFADGSSTEPFFFCKETISTICYFFLTTTKWWHKTEYSHDIHSTCSLVSQLSSSLNVIIDCCSLIFSQMLSKRIWKKEIQYTKTLGIAKGLEINLLHMKIWKMANGIK